VWFPELADDARDARFAVASSIELVRALPGRPLRHAIFDHDGTLSTLRQGWERIMEPMMVRAILGERIDHADERLLARATDEVRGFIDRTTGIQTLVQMQGLVELVQRFGCVPADRVLDHVGYKALYNQALMEMVRERTDRLASGELASDDFQIKNARALLERLHAAGVVLHLASGTDQGDLASEAQAMGYAHLFTGGIHGAVGDVNVEAKREVMDRILREHAGQAFAVFGDGPVEIREGRRRDAVCVGVASDELRRFGVDQPKRRRLIRAGADIIVGDYSQLDRLLPLVGIA
nr:HAD family hydrolase [Planctomycetota bacterium]